MFYSNFIQFLSIIKIFQNFVQFIKMKKLLEIVWIVHIRYFHQEDRGVDAKQKIWSFFYFNSILARNIRFSFECMPLLNKTFIVSYDEIDFRSMPSKSFNLRSTDYSPRITNGIETYYLFFLYTETYFSL